MKERPQKSNLASENDSTDSIDNEMVQDDDINQFFGDMDQFSVQNNSPCANPMPSSASTTATTLPASSIAAFQDSVPYRKRFN